MEQDINAKLYAQTPNSPDINLLDLGFLEPFRTSMMHHQRMKKSSYNRLLRPVTTFHDTS